MKTWITALTCIMIAVCSGFSLTAKAAPANLSSLPTMAKRDMIERLKKLKETQSSELANLETAIRKQLQDSMSLNVSNEEVRFATAKAGLLAKRLDELNSRRAELNARREMIDRLIFAVDSKYSNQPIQQFLEQQFLEMASTDLSEARDSRMWKAYTYFSIAMREVPEPREDMFNVIESYMNFSNVLDPKTPAEFLASRNYTNGVQSVAARPVSRESIGDDIPDTVTRKSGVRAMTLELTLPPKTVSTATADTVSSTSSQAPVTTVAPAATATN